MYLVWNVVLFILSNWFYNVNMFVSYLRGYYIIKFNLNKLYFKFWKKKLDGIEGIVYVSYVFLYFKVSYICI